VKAVTYLILAYLTLGAQIGLGAYVQVAGAAPNLVLLAVAFIALNAPKEPALLGCFMLGLMQDLLTQQTLGIFALSYGLVAMFVISTQQLVYREHPLTHISITFSACILTAVVTVLHGLFRLEATERVALTKLSYITLYTTALSPIILGVLQKLRKPFGFQTKRLRVTG
jgi:rod shape-determining protein MreD